MISTLEDLKQKAVAIKEGSIAFRPSQNKKVVLNPKVSKDLEHCFCSNEGIVSFVDEGKMYVIPFMASVQNTLNVEGFKRKPMNVPISKDEYPLDEKKKWDSLKEMVIQEREERFRKDCEKFADRHGYGTIASNLLDDYCLMVPEKGITVNCPGKGSDVYYPEVISTNPFGSKEAHSVGKYCIDRGVCSFVYRDGKTYYTKSKKVISALQSAGYMLGNLFIPFISGEVITDQTAADKWKKIA